MFYVKNRPKTLENTWILCYNLFRSTGRFLEGKMVHNDTENSENTFIKGFLNINACFIWFCNLFIICRYSGQNVSGCCGLSERSIRRAVCQVTGRKNPDTHTKNQSRFDRIFQSRIWQQKLVEILTQSHKSSRDLIIRTRRDTHHHSSSHILYEYRKLVEIFSKHLVETCHHMHTYIASSRDMCYHMCIHFEIHHA